MPNDPNIEVLPVTLAVCALIVIFGLSILCIVERKMRIVRMIAVFVFASLASCEHRESEFPKLTETEKEAFAIFKHDNHDLNR